MSSMNPFRTPAQTALHTGVEASHPSTSASSDHSADNESEPWTDIELPPSPTGELPPPYSATADYSSGEASVEFGPRRPFQQQQPPFAPQSNGYFSAQPTGFLNHQSTGNSAQDSGWLAGRSDYLGRQHASSSQGIGLHNASVTPNNRHEPPPRHPTTSTSKSRPNLHGRAVSENVSEFARDFYAVGDQPVGSSDNLHVPGQYEPPSGQPPPHPPLPNSAFPSSSSAPASTRPGSEPLNDGKPSETPIPGRPLLNRNRVLVYPKGFECHKCFNTGYKSYDPSNPCRRCWERYAKGYTGAIAYAPWSQDSPYTNYQRPLPLLPHTFPTPQNSEVPPPPLPRLLSRHQPSPSLPTSTYRQPSMVRAGAGSGPSPLIVRPGDPRIGGRLCWKCFGSGTTAVFIFEDTCTVCGGVGRIV